MSVSGQLQASQRRESPPACTRVLPTRMFAPHAPTTATCQLDQVTLNYISAEWGSAVRSTIPRRSIARADIGAQLKDRQALPRALDSRGTTHTRRWRHPLPRKRLVRGECQRTRHACSLVVFSAYRRHTQRARRLRVIRPPYRQSIRAAMHRKCSTYTSPQDTGSRAGRWVGSQVSR